MKELNEIKKYISELTGFNKDLIGVIKVEYIKGETIPYYIMFAYKKRYELIFGQLKETK